MLSLRFEGGRTPFVDVGEDGKDGEDAVVSGEGKGDEESDPGRDEVDLVNQDIFADDHVGVFFGVVLLRGSSSMLLRTPIMKFCFFKGSCGGVICEGGALLLLLLRQLPDSMLPTLLQLFPRLSIGNCVECCDKSDSCELASSSCSFFERTSDDPAAAPSPMGLVSGLPISSGISFDSCALPIDQLLPVIRRWFSGLIVTLLHELELCAAVLLKLRLGLLLIV